MKIKNLDKVSPQWPEQLGQTVSALSTSVVLASDYVIPVTLTLDKDTGVVAAETLRVTIGTDDTVMGQVQASLTDISMNATLTQVDVANIKINTDVMTNDGSLSRTRLENIDGKLPALGAAASSNSVPVTVASDQWSTVTDFTAILTSIDSWGMQTWSALDNLTTLYTSVLIPSITNIETQSLVQSGSLSNIDAQTTSLDGKVHAGTGLASGAVRAVLATDQPAIPVTQSGSFSVDLVSRPARSKVALLRNIHTSSPVSTSAYVQLTNSTSGTIRKLHIFDSSGSALYLAVGAAASEVDTIIIPPGGCDIEVTIASGSRLSVKAIDTATSSGQLLITALS